MACGVSLQSWLKSVWLSGCSTLTRKKKGAGREEGEGPEDADSGLYLVFGDNHLGLEGKQMVR